LLLLVNLLLTSCPSHHVTSVTPPLQLDTDNDKFVTRTEGVSKQDLDTQIEAWLKSTLSAQTLNFEINDALRMVKEQGAIHEEADGKLRARNIDQVLGDLGKKWDTYF
jgi:hypothetical protein